MRDDNMRGKHLHSGSDRMNISVPRKLKERMGKMPWVNWSKVATQAFGRVVACDLRTKKLRQLKSSQVLPAIGEEGFW